jgi:hypothetical protein
VDDGGRIVGEYFDAAGGFFTGFLKIGSDFTTISFPGRPWGTFAADINNRGVIAGTFDYWFFGFVAWPTPCGP